MPLTTKKPEGVSVVDLSHSSMVFVSGYCGFYQINTYIGCPEKVPVQKSLYCCYTCVVIVNIVVKREGI